MSGRKSKEFWLSKRAENQGSRPTAAHAGGRTTDLRPRQSTADPHIDVQPISDPRTRGPSTSNPQRIPDSYPGGQRVLVPTSGSQGAPISLSSRNPTLVPHFGVQPTPNPRSSDQPTSNQQNITDPYPSGQRALNPRSSGQSTPDLRLSVQPIKTGIYIITNVHHYRRVYLEDANDNTPLVGHYRPGNRNARWHVINYGNEQYSIENVEYGRYADSGDRAVVKAHVEGGNDERLWRIQVLPTGEYTIATTDSRNFWMLPSDIAGTPVELFNVYTDRRCWWTFGKSTIPTSEHATAPPAPIQAKPPLSPSGQSMPEDAIAGFTSAITKATGLLQPLRAVCAALRVLLQTSESAGHVNEDHKALIKRLKFHLATVENDIAKLEEDQKIDENIPALNQDVKESLETYAREVEDIYELLIENQSKSSSLMPKVTAVDHNREIIAEKTREIDDAFQRYTTALHQFAANTVTQIQQQLAQFRQEFKPGAEKAHTAAETPRRNQTNAYGIQHRECLQGTREKTLLAIGNWLDDEDTKTWIFFFLDIAGSGKSTVAKHMAEKWKQENLLLAQFFFSRDTAETMSTNSFCSTVAGAFADQNWNYKLCVDEFMERPNARLLPFKERFEGLVARPLRKIGRRAVLIIDALDECDAQQRDELLRTLRDQHSFTPLLRILATGRPERDIKRWAEEKFGFGYMNFTRLEEGDKDVELYIRHTLRDIPDIQDRLYPVISHAEGLFIWARIACDLLLDSDDVEGLLGELGKEVSLDNLYKVALEQSMPKEGASRRAMVMVLQMILAAKEPLSIAELEILFPKRGVVEKVVTRLSSLFLYQGREDPIRLLHVTFREYLTTQSRANNLFIQPELGHHMLASACLTTISNQSKQNNFILRRLDPIPQRKENSLEQDTY